MKIKNLIELNPSVCFGKPVFAGTRIPVYMVVELLASGEENQEILKDYYPSLTIAHLKAALYYAAELLKNEEVVLAKKTPHAVSL